MNSPEVEIRWLISANLPRLVEIEACSSQYPWDEEDFRAALRQRNCIGMGAFHGGHLVGHMIYEMYLRGLHVINFCVDPEFRRQGIGTKMCQKLISKLNPQKRVEIIVKADEWHLDTQLFFRSQGFLAVEVLREFYDNKHDAYLMRYCLSSHVKA